MLPGHVVDAFGLDPVLALFGPEHDHAAHHQGTGHRDGVEQVMVDQVGEGHTQDHRGEEGHQQVDREALGAALGGQADHDVEDLPPVLPDHGEDGRQLDDDVEGDRSLPGKAQQVSDHYLVAGAGDRQELRQALDNPQNDGLHGRPQIHRNYPPRRACRAVFAFECAGSWHRRSAERR
ncbi:hypothetical protein D3C78_1099680 [compost metagenome]